MRSGALAAPILVALLGGTAFANPQGASVVAGSVTIGAAGNSLTVKQTTNRAIINWQSFSIGSGQTTNFVEPSAASAILNRVTGGDPSVLLGRLQSNGQVYLINPNGIMVGPNGVVDTRGFIASTLDVPDAAFQQGGSLTFSSGSTATITNLGTIKTTSGDVALIALNVVNGGSILAPNGQAILAGGNEVLYVPGGQSQVVIQPGQTPGGASVDNAGRIKAAEVQLKAAGSPYALAVNNTGQVNATGVRQVGGRVVLDGGDGDVETGGTITAPGGSATLTGGRVAVTGGVDVSAPSSGGSIAVQATNSAVVAPGATLDANATRSGNGGAISVKSSGTTTFAGAASATGGPKGGNGGTAEISGETASVTGTVDLVAALGKGGTFTLDPATIDICNGAGCTVSPGSIEGVLNGGGAVDEAATTSIVVNAQITATGSGALTLDAPTITLNDGISIPGTLTFQNTSGNASVALTSVSTAAISAGSVTIAGTFPTTLAGAITTPQLLFLPPQTGMGAVAATNGGNSIAALGFGTSGNVNALGDIDIVSGSAMNVGGSGDLVTLGNPTIQLIAAGNLTMAAGFSIVAGGQITLASTGGAFINQAGAELIGAGGGRAVIYSSTDSGGFTQGGLGYPQYNPVSYGTAPANDPESALTDVIYIATSTALPALTITADSVNRLYGATGPAFTFNGGSTSLASLAIQPQLALSNTGGAVTNSTTLNAGAYTITPSGAISDQNALSFATGTFTVNPAPLTITASNQLQVYGSPFAFTGTQFTTSALQNGETVGSVTLTSSGDTAVAAVAGGPYGIVPSAATGGTFNPSNYSISYVNGSLTVNPASLTITATNESQTYGSPFAFTGTQFSTNGLKNGETVGSVALSSSGDTAAAAVNTYLITASNPTGGTFVASNYTISLANGTLSVTPAPLTITAANESQTYGSPLAFTGTQFSTNGLKNGETVGSVTLTSSGDTATTSVAGGPYAIVPSGATGGTFSASNYSISYANGSLTVNPAPLLITASNVSQAYGSGNVTFTGASYTGLVNGDGSGVVSGLTIATSAVIVGGIGVTPHIISGAGDYSLTPSGASAANYTITYANGTLTITPAPLTITANASKVYGAALPTALPSSDFAGFVNGDTVASLTTQPTLGTAATAASNVGFYALTASGAADANYTISYVAGNLTVTPAALTITANATKIYGAAVSSAVLPSSDFAGFVNGDTIASLTTQPTIHTLATASSPVGSTALTNVTGVADANYTITVNTGTMTITPAPLLITASNASQVYGSSNLTFGASFSGFVNGDTASMLSGLTVGTSAVVGGNIGSPPHIVSGVGSYSLTPSGASAANYTISYANGTLTITPAPLVITPNMTRLYGGSLPSILPASDFAGLANGDSPSVLTTQPTLNTTATAASNVGAYTITASGASAANYQIFTLPGTLTVNPAPLTLTPTGPSAINYGSPVPVFSVAISGLVNGDTTGTVFNSLIIVGTTATSSSPVGSYPTSIAAATSIDRNYALQLDAGTLTIIPAPLAIAANNATGALGQALPTLTGTFTGLVNGQTGLGVGYGFTAGFSTPASNGNFPITLTGSDPNYAVSFKPGLLTVGVATAVPSSVLPSSVFTSSAITTSTGTTLTSTETTTYNPLSQLTTTEQAEQQYIQNALNPVSNLVMCMGACAAFGVGPAAPEFDSIVNQFVAAMAGSITPPPTYASIMDELSDPATGAEVMGTLMPFIYSDLSNILSEPSPQWTPAQAGLVQAVENYMQAQQEAAAQEAEAQYQAWAQQEQASLDANIAAMPVSARIQYMAVLSTNPPVPPDSILQTVKAGLSMTNGQLATYTAISNQTVQVGAELESGTGAATSFIPGAVADLATITGLVSTQTGNIASSKNILRLAPSLKTLLPSTASANAFALARAEEAVKTAKTAEEIADANQALKDLKNALGAAEAATSAIPVVGVIVDVVGNVIQAGVAVAQYAQIGDFNKAMTSAVNAAYQPITNADLQSQIGTTSGQAALLSYLTAMAATGGQPPPVSQPTMSLSNIISTATSY